MEAGSKYTANNYGLQLICTSNVKSKDPGVIQLSIAECNCSMHVLPVGDCVVMMGSALQRNSPVLMALCVVGGGGGSAIKLSRLSLACWRRSATCAAMTRWRSMIRMHLSHVQSLKRQYRLWPLSQDSTPWLRHLAHLGVLWSGARACATGPPTYRYGEP